MFLFLPPLCLSFCHFHPYSLCSNFCGLLQGSWRSYSSAHLRAFTHANSSVVNTSSIPTFSVGQLPLPVISTITDKQKRWTLNRGLFVSKDWCYSHHTLFPPSKETGNSRKNTWVMCQFKTRTDTGLGSSTGCALFFLLRTAADSWAISLFLLQHFLFSSWIMAELGFHGKNTRLVSANWV